MSDATHQHVPISAAEPPQQPWSERALAAALSRFSPRLACADLDLLVTLAIFSGVGLLASLLLLILDHQLNGQLPNL
jgi:hypothetical protein